MPTRRMETTGLRGLVILTWVLAMGFWTSCGDDASSTPRPDAAIHRDAQGSQDAAQDAAVADSGSLPDAAPDAQSDGSTETDAAPPPTDFVAITFNTGIHPHRGDEGLTQQQLDYLDQYYGNGLAWPPAMDRARSFLQNVNPDIVAFQEIFDIDECANIPQDAWDGFVCENWQPGDPPVALQLLGSGYQVACNWHKHDKCVAVRRSFGHFQGCTDDYCPDGLFGTRINDCGSGARVGRGIIELETGGTITLVHVHGSSGTSSNDKDCRMQQVEQVFDDLGDGEPAANGATNLILGDFNTDPRSNIALALDASARRWADFVGDGKDFHFINDYVATYENTFLIDNQVSNVLTGDCWYPGFNGQDPVSQEDWFDHTPTVCTIDMP